VPFLSDFVVAQKNLLLVPKAEKPNKQIMAGSAFHKIHK
jgi:hypothetical protein